MNGNAYQLDESGYDTLREYLAGAETALAANPDRAEIMADLEQAIAEKCQRFLGPHKAVVSASEIGTQPYVTSPKKMQGEGRSVLSV